MATEINLPGIRGESWINKPTYELFEGKPVTEKDKFKRMRMICNDLNILFCRLEEDCTPLTCNEMKAGEWLYLCAAHDEPKQCSAIDYIAHTLEGASILLNSDLFYTHEHNPETTGKLIQNVARRLYRIFAHTWYHHKEIFVDFESETALYQKFLQFTTRDYEEMITIKMITIPQ